MKLFKTFFEDNETIGDIDIYADRPDREAPQALEIGRASCRERV